MGAPGLAVGLDGAAAAGGRGALAFGFGGGLRRSRPGIGTSDVGWSDGSASGTAADGGGIDAGVAAGGSPRSIESSLRVSRSIALTASHDDSDATSTVRLSASGEPTANSWISGRLAAWPAAVEARVTRMSA